MSLPTGIISSSRELEFTLVMGIYFSGSGFLVDLIQKQSVEDPLSGLEYLLPQLGGGIFDLDNAVRNVRTPNCQTIAYKRFIDLLTRLDRPNSFWKSGFGYRRVLPDFFCRFKTVVDDLIVNEFQYDVFQEWLERSKFQKLFGRYIDKGYANILLNETADISGTFAKAHSSIFSNSEKGHIMINQGGSAWNLSNTLKLYENCKIILVVRDPIDHFFELKKFKRAENAESFCVWYERIRDKLCLEESKDVFLCTFEDLIYRHDAVVDEISRFCNLEFAEGFTAKELQVSKQNIGTGKKYLPSDEVALLSGLPKFESWRLRV